MDKQIKDYLSLYLGCRFILDDGKGNVRNQPLTIYNLNFYKDYYYFIKPILRHLSDMSEEEAVELFKSISLFDLSECEFDWIEDESSFCINAEFNGKVIDAMQMDVNSDLVYMMNNDGSFSPLNPQSVAFKFFLSKHFDLFGLIEAGLAIDKTTLTIKQWESK